MQEVANQAAKAGCDARAVLARCSSRDLPTTDSENMSEAEKDTAQKFIRLMQVRDRRNCCSLLKEIPRKENKF